MSEQRYRPFSNGTDFAYWYAANCARCAKCNPTKTTADEPGCTMEMELALGSVSSGEVSMETARRCGLDDSSDTVGCLELEAVQE